jgi:hypothetical protein
MKEQNDKMILRNCDMNEFMNRIREKQLICFGAGKYANKIFELFPRSGIENHIRYFVDNDPALWGTKVHFNGIEIAVEKPAALYGSIDSNTVVLITAAGRNAMSIFAELEAVPESKDAECYFAHFFKYELEASRTDGFRLAPDGFRMNDRPVIPKTIHYFWFGGSEIPKKNRECIASWKKFCPDYDMVLWNEDNYDITKNQFMFDAHKSKKWAFVPDFARIDVIHEYGGIYLDTDVELLKPLDELLYNTAFCGFQSNALIAFGLGVGSIKGLPIFREFMKSYENLAFAFDENDVHNTLRPLASPYLQTDAAINWGLAPNGEFQVVGNMACYPPVYFDSLGIGLADATKHTYARHWYDGSWWPGHGRALRELSDLRKLAAKNEGIAVAAGLQSTKEKGK